MAAIIENFAVGEIVLLDINGIHAAGRHVERVEKHKGHYIKVRLTKLPGESPHSTWYGYVALGTIPTQHYTRLNELFPFEEE